MPAGIVLITYLFLLAEQTQSVTQKLLKRVFFKHSQICMFKKGMKIKMFPRKENISKDYLDYLNKHNNLYFQKLFFKNYKI